MANPPPPKMPAPPKKPVAAWRVKVGKVTPWLYALFVLGGLVQVFLAGYGIENLGDQGMGAHVDFAHALEMVPLLIILLGFLSPDWRAGVGGVVLFALFFVQYMVLGNDVAAVSAVHAANGVLLILVAFTMFLRRLPWAARPVPPPKA